MRFTNATGRKYSVPFAIRDFMTILRSHAFKRALAIGIGAGIGILYALSAIAANADTVPTVSISGTGQLTVRGASVASVHGDEIVAVSKWGTTKITWKIAVTNATRIVPDRSERPVSELFSVGDSVGFVGQLDQRGSAFTVYPTTLRNETVVRDSTVLNGSVIEATDDGLLIATETGTSTILVGTGTIMTKDGNKARSSDMLPGETLKAFGTFNVQDRVLIATRIVSITEPLPKIPNTRAPRETGWFSRVMSWIGSGGPFASK